MRPVRPPGGALVDHILLVPVVCTRCGIVAVTSVEVRHTAVQTRVDVLSASLSARSDVTAAPSPPRQLYTYCRCKKKLRSLSTYTHNRFTALLEYVQDHPGEQVQER